jgi:hypothetical protein
LPPKTHRKAHHRRKVLDKSIAFVFEVEFEPPGRKYGCTPRRLAISSCKRQCGGLEQKNSADLAVDVTGDSKAFLVAADEKCRDRPVDDAGIERLKSRDRGHGGLLTNLVAMMCRRQDRNARWLGVASHRRDIRTPETDDAVLIGFRLLCRAYEGERDVASISYAVMRIFRPMARTMS